MAENHTRGVRSTASIRGHPVHPMLIPFPIAFLVGALVTDLGFWASFDPFWATASRWLVGAGLVMGVLAGVFGLTDFVTIGRAREQVVGTFLGWVACKDPVQHPWLRGMTLVWGTGRRASTTPW